MPKELFRQITVSIDAHTALKFSDYNQMYSKGSQIGNVN